MLTCFHVWTLSSLACFLTHLSLFGEQNVIRDSGKQNPNPSGKRRGVNTKLPMHHAVCSVVRCFVCHSEMRLSCAFSVLIHTKNIFLEKGMFLQP
jgi:hypothetical protein